MNRVMAPLPKRELCRYEQIREDNIREREDAMVKFNFYESLDKTKEDIGLYGNRAGKIERKIGEGEMEHSSRGGQLIDCGKYYC